MGNMWKIKTNRPQNKKQQNSTNECVINIVKNFRIFRINFEKIENHN